MEHLTVSVRNGQFTTHLVRGGQGAPLVYLHAAGGLQEGSPWLAALARHYTVYAPWHPGWGPSTGLEHLDDVRDLATYYLDLFDALGLARVALVGHSFGGMVAAEVAAQCGAYVDKLVLVAPVGLWREDAPVADIFTMSPRELVEAAVADPAGPLAQQLVQQQQPEDAERQAALQLERIQALAAAGKFLWPIPDKGLKKRLHRIKAPTLVLWGEADRLVPPVYAEEFRARLVNAPVQVQVVPGAGHLLPLEQPDTFVRAVRAFLG